MDDVHFPTREEYEDHLLEMISSIDRSAREAAKPYVDALVRLRSQDPPRPFFLAKEQAEPAKWCTCWTEGQRSFCADKNKCCRAVATATNHT